MVESRYYRSALEKLSALLNSWHWSKNMKIFWELYKKDKSWYVTFYRFSLILIFLRIFLPLSILYWRIKTCASMVQFLLNNSLYLSFCYFIDFNSPGYFSHLEISWILIRTKWWPPCFSLRPFLFDIKKF